MYLVPAVERRSGLEPRVGMTRFSVHLVPPRLSSVELGTAMRAVGQILSVILYPSPLGCTHVKSVCDMVVQGYTSTRYFSTAILRTFFRENHLTNLNRDRGICGDYQVTPPLSLSPFQCVSRSVPEISLDNKGLVTGGRFLPFCGSGLESAISGRLAREMGTLRFSSFCVWGMYSGGRALTNFRRVRAFVRLMFHRTISIVEQHPSCQLAAESGSFNIVLSQQRQSSFISLEVI